MRTSRKQKTVMPSGQAGPGLLFPRPESQPRADGDIYRSLLDNVDSGLAVATPKGVVLYANARFAMIFDVELHNLIGSDLRNALAVESRRSFLQALTCGATSPAEGLMRVLSAGDGPPRAIRLHFSPVQWEDGLRNDPPHGGARAIQIVATEVTELVQASEALERTEASLQSVSARLLKLQDEERRRISRDLHDTIGQELALVIMTLGQFAKEHAGSEDGHTVLHDCATRLRDIENAIRTMSYVLHPPLLDEMGLGTALKWYLEGFAKRTGIQVEADIPDDVPRLSMEKETALFRVIQEGLTNVFRHSGSSRARVSLRVGNFRIEAAVEDEGKGVRGKNINDKAQQGLGIQSMTGRLEAVGGKFRIHSSPQGTRLEAYLPFVPDGQRAENAPSDRQTKISQAGESRRKRILVADDHHVARQGIRMLLSAQPDLEICGEACDGVELIERAKELSPDLIIVDLDMPNLSGLSAAGQLRRSGVKAKTLVYTAHSYDQLEKAIRTAGCDGYVVKSNASQDLIRAVRTVLGGGQFYLSQSAKAQTA